MKLKEKLQTIIDRLGFATSNMENMMFAIEQAESGDMGYFVDEACEKVTRTTNDRLKAIKDDVIIDYGYRTLVWTLNFCIGEYVEYNNLRSAIGLNF